MIRKRISMSAIKHYTLMRRRQEENAPNIGDKPIFGLNKMAMIL